MNRRPRLSVRVRSTRGGTRVRRKNTLPPPFSSFWPSCCERLKKVLAENENLSVTCWSTFRRIELRWKPCRYRTLPCWSRRLTEPKKVVLP